MFCSAELWRDEYFSSKNVFDVVQCRSVVLATRMTALHAQRGLVVAMRVPMAKLSEVRTPRSSLTRAAALVPSVLCLIGGASREALASRRSAQRGRPGEGGSR